MNTEQSLSGYEEELRAAKSRASLAEEKVERQSILLAEKTSKIQRLHTMIAQSVPQANSVNDGAIDQKFRKLWYEIARLQKQWFPDAGDATGWSRYDGGRDGGERGYILRSEIASAIAEKYFGPVPGPAKKLFGFSQECDAYLADIESALENEQLPQSELTQWRVQTIRVAQLRGPSRAYSDLGLKEHFLNIERELFLKRAEQPGLSKAIDSVCELALELALATRSCRSRYVWEQSRSKTTLFGPVYKLVDNERELIHEDNVP